MSIPHTAPPTQVPIPIGGMNWLDPLAATEPLYSPWLNNVEVETQYIRARGSYVEHADATTETSRIQALGQHGTKLFAYADAASGNHAIYDVTAGGTIGSPDHTTGATTAAEAFPIYFAGALYFITDANYANQNRYTTDGSSWSSWGFTESAADVGGLAAGGYKGRFYFFNGFTGYYGGLGSYTGATTLWDLSDVFALPEQTEGGIAWMNTLSSATNVSNEQFLCVGSFAGEVLVYAGDNPNAANWELIARFVTSPPIQYNCSIEYNNDVLFLTAGGLISVRKLLSNDSDVLGNISISQKFEPFWLEHIKNIGGISSNLRSSDASIAYWPEQNKLYILMRGKTDQDLSFDSQDATMFVYNGYTGAWYIHQMEVNQDGAIENLIYFNDALYFPTDEYVTKYEIETYSDDVVNNVTTAVDWRVKSAHMSLGQAHKYKKLSGIEPVFKSDNTTAGAITAYVVSDFGRKTSAASTQTLPSISSDFHNTSYLLGVEGTYLQWWMEGAKSSGSTPFELYSMGMLIS